METKDQYLAVFVGDKNSPRHKEWDAMTKEQQKAKEKEGQAAWGQWFEKNANSIVSPGGPLGKTKRISRDGMKDVTNNLAVFMVVRAPSHEAATKIFADHPHFTIFPGEAIEVMPLIPIPGM